jgi:nitrate reductase cytochrome c-type subunit
MKHLYLLKKLKVKKTMVKKSLFIIPIIITILFTSCTKAPKNPYTIRGTKKLDDSKITLPYIQHTQNQTIEKGNIFERRYKDFPPVVSHNTNGMQITKKENSCLTCHTQQENKKLSSHFQDNTIQSDKYMCLSCHTTKYQ